ncbi:unnamed protein product [Cladocopium goreaui]|uniref:Uncharacterized protein n=1 Tax=Cladocopium goreaui TaxID=2562237 RepID=A0A9P1D0H0_9DINO|nr:unnamed protein product [Cladocopium goreaui]
MPAASTALHYIALAPELQMEWARTDLHDLAIDLFLSRALKLKDFEPLPETLPADQQPELLAPALNVGTVDGLNLQLPQSLAAKWGSSSFKDDWEALLEEMNAVIPVKDNVDRPSKRLRTSNAVDLVENPAGATKFEFIHVAELDMTKVLIQASCSNKLKGLSFQLFPSNRLMLVNTTPAPIPVVGYHILIEHPQGQHGPGDFTVEVKHQVAWRAEKMTVEGGMDWPDGVPDLAEYMYQMESPFCGTKPWVALSDRTSDVRMESLLRWMANYEIHFAGDRDVICFEELVFQVREYSISQSGPWMAEVELWGVWEQEQMCVRFKLTKDHFGTDSAEQ